MPLSALKPAVSKNWLLVIAGLVWTVAGLMLIQMAYWWLRPLQPGRAVFLGFTGMVLAAMAHRYLFSKIARKNIARISDYMDKGCIFAFQAWKSYVIVMAMITMGVLLRHSDFPRDALAVMYTAMGGALILSSGHYFVTFWRAVAPRS